MSQLNLPHFSLTFYLSSSIYLSISIYYVHKLDAQWRPGHDICPLPADVRDSCFRGGAGTRGANLLWLRCQATDSSEQSQRASCEPLTAVVEQVDIILR